MGFVFVPIPLYKAGDDYLAHVHNLARIVAISKTTTEFEQCTKFLDYQSRNSARILKAYYGTELVAQVDCLVENVYMINYIKNHARDCFDKTYDDLLSAHLAGNGSGNANMNKQDMLEDILAAWDKLSVPR